MATVNQEQRKYCSARLSEIMNRKRAEIAAKYPVTPGKTLSDDEKLDLIKSGKARLKAKVRTGHYGYLHDAFDFSKFETEDRPDPRQHAETEKAERECERIRDTIFLGDATEAFEMLRAFDK